MHRQGGFSEETKERCKGCVLLYGCLYVSAVATAECSKRAPMFNDMHHSGQISFTVCWMAVLLSDTESTHRPICKRCLRIESVKSTKSLYFVPLRAVCVFCCLVWICMYLNGHTTFIPFGGAAKADEAGPSTSFVFKALHSFAFVSVSTFRHTGTSSSVLSMEALPVLRGEIQ